MLWRRRLPRFHSRSWLALALACGGAWGQAPSYSAASIGNTSDGSPGPFAPNSVLSLYGANLSYSTAIVSQGGTPLSSVLVENTPAPLLYVSPTQINFLIPSNQIPGPVTVQVVRQGLAGPAVTITLVAAAPALFANGGYAIAEDWNAANAAVTPNAPAQPGDMIELYATGLGHTQPNYNPGEIPTNAAHIDNWTTLQVLLNGAAIDPALITYAGLTPFSTGLYQINFFLPATAPPDPEIRVAFAGETSIPGLKLAVETSASPVGFRETSLP